MPVTDVAPIEASIEIAAPPERVWALVSDPRNYTRWSPQVVRTIVRGDRVGVGTRLVNLNRRKALVWPTTAKVIRLEPGKTLAFRMEQNHTVWSYTLEPTDTGTRLVERRDAPEGIADSAAFLINRVMGGVDNFAVELKQGMNATLAKIKAEAER